MCWTCKKIRTIRIGANIKFDKVEFFSGNIFLLFLGLKFSTKIQIVWWYFPKRIRTWNNRIVCEDAQYYYYRTVNHITIRFAPNHLPICNIGNCKPVDGPFFRLIRADEIWSFSEVIYSALDRTVVETCYYVASLPRYCCPRFLALLCGQETQEFTSRCAIWQFNKSLYYLKPSGFFIIQL
jgi:hypothetical protein